MIGSAAISGSTVSADVAPGVGERDVDVEEEDARSSLRPRRATATCLRARRGSGREKRPAPNTLTDIDAENEMMK